MPWTSKTIAILATAASLFVVYVGVSTFTGTALAFADVVEALNKVRSATWKTMTESTKPNSQVVSSKSTAMFLAPAHERMETTFMGAKSIMIMDGQKDKAITLVPSTKMAMVIELKNLPSDREGPFGYTFQGFRELAANAMEGKAGKVEGLGAETIDDRPVQGFRIQRGSTEVTIWADQKTLLPVRVEQTTTSGPKSRTTMTDFQVNVDLDESLFRLEVPKDYAIEQTVQLDVSKNPIYYLAQTLKLVAEINNGVFPSTLRGEKGIDGILSDSKKLAEKLGLQAGKDAAGSIRKLTTDFTMGLGATFGFLSALSPEQNDWHYAGQDVKLNTPNTAIFWFRRNKSSTTYHVLYADLSVKEVPAKDAPRVAPNKESPKP